MADDLTIVLTLRGRHLHTLRWLWHANRTRLPFHVFIADGEVHPAVDRLLTTPSTFPDLSFEYHRYCDRSYRDYYDKCADTLTKVRTKYAMFTDNDDFLFPSGLKQSLAFLDRSPTYVCAGGNIRAFTIHARPDVPEKVLGELATLPNPIGNSGYPCADIEDSLAAERVLAELRQYQITFYHVTRTEALRAVTAEIAQHDFADLEAHEYYWVLRTVTQGKVKTDPSHLSYFRQLGTSGASGPDWVDRALRGQFVQDYAKVTDSIAREAGRVDGSDPDVLKDRMLEESARRIRTTLAHTMLRYRFPKLFAVKQRLLKLPRASAVFPVAKLELDRRRLWRILAAHGAEKSTLKAHAAELREVEATLQGDEFLRFVKSNAPDLLPS